MNCQRHFSVKILQACLQSTIGKVLKKQKSSSRFPEKVKLYLNDRFLIGEETGNKASLTQVAPEMRRERDDNGDCLSSQQVAVYNFLSLSSNEEKTWFFSYNCRQ